MWSPIVFSGCVEDLAIFLPMLFKDVLWGDEAVGHESPQPVGGMDDVVAALLLVCGSHDLAHLSPDGRVITLFQYRSALSRVVDALK